MVPEIIQTSLIVALGIIEYLGLKKFNDSYMGKKGENLATKEDIRELTSLSEEIKNEFANKHYHEQQIYNIKLEAINNSLDFIDKYISWHTIDDNKIPVREQITTEQLTTMARNCYNRLIITCQSEKLLDCFNNICFHEQENIFKLYALYRNLAREELGLNELSLDKDKVFYSKISTKDLTEKSE